MRALGLVLAGAAIVLVGQTTSATDGPVICPEGQSRVGGVCTIVIDVPGEGATTPGLPPGGGSDGGTGETTCRWNEADIPCESVFGAWLGSCYIEAADPQPPKSDPVWEGNDDGVIVVCTPFPCVPVPGRDYIPDCPGRSVYWAPAAPTEAGPAPRELADRAVAQMGLGAGQIGMAPPADKGIIGIPVWLWIADPGASTTGPITRSVSAGGVTVTATGTLDRIVYDMGDGNQVECMGPGTPFTPGPASSPDCGYTYTESSDGQPANSYTVTATCYWTVTWAGGGQRGAIPLEYSRSMAATVGELQALTTR